MTAMTTTGPSHVLGGRGSAIAVGVRTAAALTEISETTIRDAINKQRLPAYRVGRSIRIKVDDLAAWIDSLVRVGSEDDR